MITNNTKLFAIQFFLIFFVSAVYADNKTEGNNSPIIVDTNGNISVVYESLGLSFETHEQLLKKEIEKVKIEIDAIGYKNKADYLNKLSILTNGLNKVLEEKKKLERIIYEYRKEISLINNKKESTKNEQLSDIELMEKSENNRLKLLSDIKKDHDTERMDICIEILISDADFMNDNVKKLFRDKLPSLSFDKKYDLLKILSNDRRKRANLGRKKNVIDEKYREQIKSIYAKARKDIHPIISKALKRKGNIKELILIDIKRYTSNNPTISELRAAETETKKLIELHPDYVDAYVHLVEILNIYKEDRSYDLKILIEDAKVRFGNSSIFNKELGYVYLRLYKKVEAYKYIKKAAFTIDNDPKLYEIFGRLSINNDEAELAKYLFKKSFDKNKDNATFVAVYSDILDFLGEAEESKKILIEYLNTNKQTSEILTTLAWRYYKGSNYGKAYTNFIKACTINKEEHIPFVMASLSLIESSGELLVAIKLMEDALSIYRGYGKFYKEEEGEINLALAIMYSETQKINKVVEYSEAGVSNTYGCSKEYMKRERNWHKKALLLLEKHRVLAGCP